MLIIGYLNSSLKTSAPIIPSEYFYKQEEQVTFASDLRVL